METAATGLAKRLANIEPHRYHTGENYYVRKAAERERLKTGIVAELGGIEKLSVTDRLLIDEAVALLMRRPRDDNQRVRHSNAAVRILQGLRAKAAAEPEPVPPLSSYAKGASS